MPGFHGAGADAQGDRPSRQDLIRSLPPVRTPSEGPQSVEVQHSSSYLYRRRQEEASLPAAAPFLIRRLIGVSKLSGFLLRSK